jgi:hypothetical protein
MLDKFPVITKPAAFIIAVASTFFVSTQSNATASFTYRTVEGVAVIEGAYKVFDTWSNRNYDVTFQDGTCNSLFLGCSPSDFSLIDSASTALDLNYALLRAITSATSTLPSGEFQIKGCEPSIYCYLLTPINDSKATPTSINTYEFFLSRHGAYPVGDYMREYTFDTSDDSNKPYVYSYASWSLSADQTIPESSVSTVPEPESYTLAISAFCSLLIATAVRRKA